MTQLQKEGRSKAIVLGGGIAGLLTARVLAAHYAQVLVLDRDAEPGLEIRRGGVPQTFHLHQMLPRGEQVLERLLPGFLDDVLRLGAFPLAEAALTWTNRYGTMTMPSPEKGAFYSRGLVEQAIRERVGSIDHVRFGYEHRVVELCAAADGTRIIGVRCQSGGEPVTLSADLVVDASGRSSKLPQWLSQLGYQAPPQETVTSGIGYSTRYYRVPRDRGAVPALLVIENDYRAGNPAGGVLKRIEGEVWSACLSGIGGQYPPVDAAGFDAGLTELISPAMAEVLSGAEPLTTPRGFRIPVCVRRHYEQMARWPAGLLVLGDAMCTVDPIYGQGMTVAAIQAEAIAEYLAEEHGPGGELELLRRLQQVSYPAWWLSALEDLRWPGVEHRGGPEFARVSLLHKYFDVALERMTQQFSGAGNRFDPTFLTFFAMTGLIAAPADVVNETMLKALLNGADTEAERLLRAEIAAHGDEIGAVLAEAVEFTV